jgi:hypothetical protein
MNDRSEESIGLKASADISADIRALLFLGPIVLPPAAAGSGGIILVGGLAF